MRRSTSSRLSGAAALVACVLSAGAAQAVVVWSDDLSGENNMAAPSQDFTNNSVNDYVASGAAGGSYTITDSIGNAAPSIQQVDPNGTAAPTLTVAASQWNFSGLSAANNLLTVEYDFRVDDFSSGVTNQNPRFVMRQANAAGQQVVVAFGRSADIDDGPNGGTFDLALAAEVPTSATSFMSPTAETAIGYISGIGWAPGFDFGNYDPDTALNDTHDQFYRISLTYDFNTGGIAGTATNTATGDSASFNRTMNAGMTFTAGSILMSSAAGNTAQSYYDNLVVSVTPEPSAMLALLAGAGLLVRRRSRRPE